MKILVFILSILPAILAGDFNAKTLSVAEQDSILNGTEATGRYRLEKENEEQIFRHSQVADWFILDTMRHTRKQLGAGVNELTNERVRDAVMSPNGRYVAFAIANNLYIHKCDFGTEVAVTKDADVDVINGVADWLYEEEFGTTALFAWSPDSKLLAFVKLDEHEVPDFSWEVYGESQYPTQQHLRYPKAGCPNAKASVCIYDVATKGIQRISGLEVSGLGGCYIPRLRWTNGGALLALRVNRDQTKMEVFSINAKSTVASLLYKEESKQYFIDYTLFDQWQWLSDDRFVMVSERDGWRRAYLYTAQGLEQKVLTPEGIDVTALYAVDEPSQTLYYQAAPTPATRQLFAVDMKKGGVTQLTTEAGIHSARFSQDGKRFIECFQSFDTPNKYTLCKVERGKVKAERVIEDNAELAEAWRANNIPEPELVKVNNLEAMLLKPLIPNPLTPNPLVIMHYSGPQSQRVLNRWRKKFEYALVEAGYAVLIVDTRGSDCRGRAWRNETYMNLGQKEAEDLIAAANWAAQRDDIDGNRMAILGWSYGGYETLFTMSQKSHPFKAGIAIAPVTDWKLYDSAYTERYMRRPQVNAAGYRNASLMNHVDDLHGAVLLIHGTGDDNVHVQQTMQYINALVQSNKDFEMQLYPDDNHHLRKGNTATHMHNRVLNFLRKAL